MANILPKEMKRNVWSFYRARFVLVGSFVLLAGACLALLALLPSILAVRTMNGFVEAPQAAMPELAQAQEERIGILRAQTLLAEFSPLASSTAPALEALNAALRARSSSIIIRGIEYTKETPGTIIISGESADRTSVSAYRDALSRDPHFTSVSVPASVLAGSGGPFSITLKGAF